MIATAVVFADTQLGDLETVALVPTSTAWWSDAARASHSLVVGGVLVAGALPSFALVTYAEKADVVCKASCLWEGRAVTRMLAILTNRDFSVLIFLFALLELLHWFLWGAALGVHIFWLTLFWLLWQIKRRETE